MNDIERAIEQIEKEKQCVIRADKCNRDCANCDLLSDTENILNSYNLAIQALQTVFLIKEEAEQKIQKNQIINCYGCKYWEEFNEVCCNDKSKYCADFVNCGCEHKEINK